jgi:hypothetical protein
MIDLEAERVSVEVDGILPVIVARSAGIVMRIPLDKIRCQQIAAAVRAQALKVQKMTRSGRR